MPNPDAQWSDELMQATKAAIEQWTVLPGGDHLCFKHIASGFGVIDFTDLMRGKLRMTVRGTGKAVAFANADELIDAGWAID